MRQSSKAASEQFRDQIAAQIEAYPKMEELQLGTIQRISDNLDNQYTQQADAALGAAAGETIKLTQAGDRIGNVASRADAIGMSAEQFAQGRTALDEQIAAEGSTAMGQRADQVSGARVSDPGRMQSTQAGPAAIVQGPQGYSPAEIRAQQINASQAGAVANVQAARTDSPERVAGTRVAGVSPIQSAQVDRVQNVRSRNIQASAAEQALMREATGGGLMGQLQNEASRDLALGRSLSAEQSRDAIQSARSGMAARGLSTGNSALAAEMLNRDRFATQRQNERRGFASGIAQQATGIQQAANQAYMGREDSNAGRNLQASLANQSTDQSRAMQNAQFAQQAGLTDNQNAQQRVLADAGYAQQAGLSNQNLAFQSSSQNAQLAQQAGLQNQATALSLGQANAQLLQQAALANQSAGLQSGQLNQAASSRASEFQQSEALRASLANQSTDLSLGLTNAQLAQQTNAANFDSANQRAFTEAGYSQQANMANQEANQRQVEMNRSFLQNANQNLINSEITRGGYALGALGQSANLYGQQAGSYQNAAALGLNIANQSMANDPYMRAFAPGTTIGGGTLGTSAQMIGNTYNSATQMAGNVASFNANMIDSRYNSYQNNQSALQGARMQAGATAGASQNAMMGMGMAGGGAAVGMIGAAVFI